MKFSDATRISAVQQGDSREVWTSLKAEKALHALEAGYEVKHPFHEGNPDYKRGNIVFEYTEWEMAEIKRCARDIVYFANTYCTVMTDEGYRKVVLRDYQEETLRAYQANRFTIFLSARQTGKTITTGIFLTWYMLFHFDRNVMLMANKGDTSKEIMSKIKAIVEGLPFFLKPGIVKIDVFSMNFDNKCRIIAGTTTKRSGISFTIHLLFLDEFAHVPDNIKEEFYQNIFPTLSSSKISRIVITSTPNGFDLFHKLYEGAIAEPKRNSYHPIKVDWWQVPGRDDEWKAREIEMLGSEEAFNAQYGCSFQTSSKLLLGAAEFKKLKANAREYVVREFEAMDATGLDYSSLRWDPVFDTDLLRSDKEQFVLTLDLSEGVGRDYSVVNIFRVVAIDEEEMLKMKSPGGISEFFGLQQVAVFRNNLFAVEDVAKIVYALMVKLFNPDNVRLVIESNIYGGEVVKDLLSMYPSSNNFDEGTLVKYKHRMDASMKKVGFKFSTENKKVYCEKTRRLISTGRMLLTDVKTVDEFQYFSRNANGTYSAQAGNDDLCMSSVLASTFFDTLDYQELVGETIDVLDSERASLIERMVDGADPGDGDDDDMGLGPSRELHGGDDVLDLF